MNKPKPTGTIRYVLLLVSLPEAPEPAHTYGFLNEIIPELRTQANASTKIGTLWQTAPLATVDMTVKAIEAFGPGVSNNGAYIYRTVATKLGSGEAKCLVVYDKD